MPMPMYHQDCGGLVLWRLGRSQEWGHCIVRSEVLLHDGTHPEDGRTLKCPRCGMRVRGPGDLTKRRELEPA